ncbi:MAG: sporulation protein YabP [Firmicutes bacterium]|nr:sporulation protein YabP [Bacillota bacterium]
MAEEKKSSASASRHALTIDRRERVVVTGMLDVISFDEETVIAETEMGILVLRGNNLRVSRLNLDNGELDLDGEIMSAAYEDAPGGGKAKGSFFGKLFR